MFSKSLIKSIKVLVISLLISLSTTATAAETITFIHTDLFNSPVAATDINGKVIWREDYRPYGRKLKDEPGSASQKIWYTGKPQDPDSGLVYMGARHYNPQLGRFISVDPVSFQEGNIHSFNRYAYANNNPYKYVDPDGELPVIALAFIAADLYLNYQSTGTVSGALAETAKGLVNPLRKIKIFSRIGSGISRQVGGDVTKSGLGKSGPDFVVTSKGKAIPVPNGASGPRPTINKGGKEVGFEFTGGRGGKGLNSRVDGVRVMDANNRQGRRAVFMNEGRQTVDKTTGRTLSNSDPRAHNRLE